MMRSRHIDEDRLEQLLDADPEVDELEHAFWTAHMNQGDT